LRDISGNLDGIYEYVTRVLAQAHAKNDQKLLDEAATLISDISSAWKQIS